MGRTWIAGGLVAALALAGAFFLLRPTSEGTAHVQVNEPDAFSAAARDGARKFAANCASCHGERAAGSDRGPPLIHKYYEPSHHGDRSFLAAVRNGVRQHHWTYGDMPPQPGVTNADVARIVAYVRELQRANGIR